MGHESMDLTRGEATTSMSDRTLGEVTCLPRVQYILMEVVYCQLVYTSRRGRGDLGKHKVHIDQQRRNKICYAEQRAWHYLQHTVNCHCGKISGSCVHTPWPSWEINSVLNVVLMLPVMARLTPTMSWNPAHGKGPDATDRPVKYGRIVFLMSARQPSTVKFFGEKVTMLNQNIDVNDHHV